MQKTLLLIALATSMLACNNNEPATLEDLQAMQDPRYADMPTIEGISFHEESCHVNWERHKEIKNMETSFKIGKSTMNLNVNNADITTSGSFNVKYGGWTISDGEVTEGYAVMDLSEIVALQVDEDEILKLRSPDYLDVEQFPTAKIDFGKVPFPSEGVVLPLQLTLKGKTATVDAQVSTTLREGEPFLMLANFSIDGVEWGLIPESKKDEVVKDSLVFQCGFQPWPDRVIPLPSDTTNQ